MSEGQGAPVAPEKMRQVGAKPEVLGERVLEVDEALRRIEKGVETADKIDEALTRSKKTQAQRQKKEAKKKKRTQKGDEDENVGVITPIKRDMNYFSNGVKKVNYLVRRDIKQAALTLRELRGEYREYNGKETSSKWI